MLVQLPALPSVVMLAHCALSGFERGGPIAATVDAGAEGAGVVGTFAIGAGTWGGVGAGLSGARRGSPWGAPPSPCSSSSIATVRSR